ncbi:hypothetical protein CQA53_03370 [Helicobacter didelphidarum]|uniref:Transglycosylase SLT domain-containing protein n=1 Tax=Helicobacter didelphidarum TaxID=2040648 RepID=A0A3D8IMM2_9HELI|nr:hypothetical protein [Helicobacter didelphidarum]RDU66498.1 hypothetical protein CQA53_03370 [Helicobacter didelphidarum]
MQRILYALFILVFFPSQFLCFAQNTNGIKIKGTCIALQDFTTEQQEILLYAYYYGKEYNFGYLMAAIAWKESCAGEYLINFSDPSAGVYHAHIPSVIKKYTSYKDSPFIRNVVGQMLVTDIQLASSIALDNLRYWAKVHNNNMKNVVKSYNKGFAWKSSSQTNRQAQNYYLDIERKIKQLETYIPTLLEYYKLNTPNGRLKHPKFISKNK